MNITMSVTPLELASKNYTEVQEIPGSDYTAGNLLQINGSYGFNSFADVASGEVGSFVVKAEKVFGAKATGGAVAAGDKAYFHVANKNFVGASASGVVECGVFYADFAANDTTCIVIFDGINRTIVA